MAEVTELVTKFSFKGSLAPLSKFKTGLGSATRKLSIFATATFGSITALNLFANSVFQSIDPIAQLSRQTGVGVEAIQELGYAAEVNGGSFEAMNKSIAGLNQRIGEAVALGTGEGVAIFEKYGISLKDASGQAKTADVVFDDLRKKIVALDLSQRQVGSIANKLGLDPSSVQLLMKSSEEMATLRDRAKELGTLTKEQIDATADYNDTLTTMKRAFNGVRNELAVSFLPRMQKVAESFTKFIIQNKELILLIGKSLVTSITGLSRAFSNIIGLFATFIKSMASSKAGIAILTVAVGGLVIAFAPLTTTVLLIAGLVLLIDDLIVMFKGGESVIGGFMEKLLEIESVKKGFQWLIDLIRDIKENAKLLASLFGVKFKETNTPKGFGSIDDARVSKVDYGKRPIPMANQSLWLDSIIGSNKPQQSSSINQNINIDIKTTDPQRAGIAVQESLQKHLNDAQSQIGVGGM